MIDTMSAIIMMLNNDHTGTSSTKQNPSSCFSHQVAAVGSSSWMLPCYTETPVVHSMDFESPPLSLLTPKDVYQVGHPPISVSSMQNSGSSRKKESSLSVPPHDHLDRHRDSIQHLLQMIIGRTTEDKNDDDLAICPSIFIEYGVNELERRRSSLPLASSLITMDNQKQQSHFSFDLRELEPTPIGPATRAAAVSPTTAKFVESCCKPSSLSWRVLSRKQTPSSSLSSTIPGVSNEDEEGASRCNDDQSPESFCHSGSWLPGGPAFNLEEAYTSTPTTYSTRRTTSGCIPSPQSSSSLFQQMDNRTWCNGGRRFRDYETDLWSERFAELLQFKEVHGHCLVPHTYSLNPLLSQWVKRQRYQFRLKVLGRHSTLTDDRHQKLDDAGFIWHCHHASWYEKLDALKKYKAQYGDCKVPPTYHNRSLAVWVKSQRRQRKLFHKGQPCSISKHRIDVLDEMGFEWNPRGL